MPQNNKWLQEGAQTKITPEIKKLAKQLKGSNDLETIFNILFWIKKNLTFIKSWKWRERHLCTQTAEQIVKSKKSSGCGDKAIVFIALIRANGIPAKYVDAVDLDWLKAKNPKFVSDHIFVDVWIFNKWYIVDPTIGTINLSYLWPMGKKFLVYKKALDSWDMGIKNYKNLENKFKIFKEKWLNKPKAHKP